MILRQLCWRNGTGAADAGFKRGGVDILEMLAGDSWNYADSVIVASATTMTLPAGNVFHISGVTPITTLNICDSANNGRLVNLIFDGITTLTDGLNLKLAGDFVTTADDAIQLICDGTNWYQVSPGSVN